MDVMTEKYAKYPHWGGLEKESGDTTTIEEAIVAADKGWEQVAYEVVEGSAVAAIEISGLDLDADGAYMLEVFLKNVSAAAGRYIYLVLNDDSNAAHYGTGLIYGDSMGNLSSGGTPGGVLCSMDEISSNEFVISRAANGKTLCVGKSAASLFSTDEILLFFSGIAYFETDNITKIAIIDEQAEAKIDVGSRVVLYKLNMG